MDKTNLVHHKVYFFIRLNTDFIYLFLVPLLAYSDSDYRDANPD